jgi:ribosome-binding factor A
MQEKQIKRIESALKDELAAIIQKEIDLKPGTLVTVTEIEISEDNRYADVYITVLPENTQGSVLTILKRASGFLRAELIHRFDWGRGPELRFQIDEGQRKADSIDSLLDEVASQLSHEDADSKE